MNSAYPSNMFGRASNAVGTAVQSAQTSIAGKGAIVVFCLVVLLLIVVVIVYIVYRMKRTDLQSVEIVKSPRNLFNESNSSAFVFPASRIPSTLNGQEYSFSFWLYLSDYMPTQNYRMLFMRGGNTSSMLGNSCPVVFLDNRTNKLYVSVRTNLSSTPSGSDLSKLLDKKRYNIVTATVEYVPLQRWVNVTFVVQDNLLTVYMDGDMYTVENVHDLYDPARGTDRPIFAGLSGDVIVGNIQNTSTTPGFISRLKYFNYALTTRDVRSLYDKGPVNTGVLSKFGVSEYGFRTPVYRLEQ